jgi:hypothetical protein
LPKRFLSVSLIVLLLNLVGAVPTYANSQDEAQARAQARDARKIKDGIMKLGNGEGARVQLTLRDGRKVEGYIREAGEDSFVVVETKTGAATTVTYSQVKAIKGNNLSSGAKIAFNVAAVVGIALGLSLLLVVVLFHGEK